MSSLLSSIIADIVMQDLEEIAIQQKLSVIILFPVYGWHHLAVPLDSTEYNTWNLQLLTCQTTIYWFGDRRWE